MKIELEGVNKRFGRIQALRDLDLCIDRGNKVALIGPNGSGKSTLTRALMGLVSYEGSVLLDGRSPREQRLALCREMAYVPQIPPQLSAPVNELTRAIVEVRGLSRQAIAETAQEIGLDLEAIEQRPFRELSGGTKQKLLIAMAFATPFSLVILDEPTASLDPGAREKFYEMYHQRANESTVILCSHRLDEVHHLVGHVLELDEGRPSYHGPADDFLGQRAIGMIEVRIPEANGQAAWLEAEGFRRGLAGWWVRRATRDEKLALLPRLSSELGASLKNVIVRDLESVEPQGESS